MMPGDHIQSLIAHYLATSYPTALPSFLEATGLPQPDLAAPPNPDLRTLAQDYLSSKLAEQVKGVTLEEKAQDGSWRGWKAKDVAALELERDVKLEKVTRSIDGLSAANLLVAVVGRIPKRTFDTTTASSPLCILVSSVDKTISIIEYESEELIAILEQKAAILSIAIHPTRNRYILTGSMDGTCSLVDLLTQRSIQTFRSTKFVVRVAFSQCGKYIATASYDKHVVIYQISKEDVPEEVLDETDDPYLACEPQIQYTEFRRIKVENNPEAILFHPNSEWLMYTTRSSHSMYYVPLVERAGAILTKSFNPHPYDTHISFAVLNMALHPSGKIIACQTGDHSGNAGERILLYGVDPDETERLACIWTGAETDDYVLPRMAWLPDGTGLVTTSPNGLLHLISITGEVRTSLKAHGVEYGQIGVANTDIVRDLAVAEQDGGQWEVVSVGFDRVVRISR